MKNIGIIGAGNIGMAIAKGMVRQKVIDPSNLFLSRKRNGLLEEQKKNGFVITDNRTLASKCEVIILAVLPGQTRELILDLKDLLISERKIVVSVVSAVSIKELKEWSGKQEK